MHAFASPLPDPVLTLPDSAAGVLSIRAKALLFHDPRSMALLEHVERIARSEASVLIVGDTGTGKELIARHLHTRSGRRGPFVAVNCGAFSENLIDAELFGHESGAFTGASQARAGWFEAANGGTLFLDEIGDLPLSLQVKLLRVLQERQVVRLGSRKPIPLDVRLVAATNVDLRQAVDAQRFRADLYYRLNVAPVSLPPLRDRPGDILPLARHFIGVYAPRLGLPEARLAAEAEAALLAYFWPGNIRELENVVHFALVICRDGWVQKEDLRLVAPSRCERPATAVGGFHATGHANEHAAAQSDMPQPEAPEPYAELGQAILNLIHQGDQNVFHGVNETLVRRAFQHCNDNQVRTAKVLGITRNTLRTFLKRYGMLADTGRRSESALDGESRPVSCDPDADGMYPSDDATAELQALA